MTLQELKEILCGEGYEDVLIFDTPDYANAFVGVSTSNRAIYDYDLMVSCLIEEEGMTEEDARDFIDYNTLGALRENSLEPIILRRLGS